MIIIIFLLHDCYWKQFWHIDEGLLKKKKKRSTLVVKLQYATKI